MLRVVAPKIKNLPGIEFEHLKELSLVHGIMADVIEKVVKTERKVLKKIFKKMFLISCIGFFHE
jgi:hypothetical protein